MKTALTIIALALALTGCDTGMGPDTNPPVDPTYYTVSFDVDGTITNQSVESGQKATQPATPTKDSYSFAGWAYQSKTSAGLDYDFSKPVTEDLTLTARWSALPVYTVTFDSGVSSQSVIQGNKASKPDDPTNAPHNFLGWYTGSSLYDFSAPVTSNVTLTAKWTKTVIVEDKVMYTSTVSYTSVTIPWTKTGSITLDLNAKTFSNMTISETNHKTSVTTTVAKEYASGTYVIDGNKISFTITACETTSSYVGQTAVYSMDSDAWTWQEDPAMYGFSRTTTPTTVTREVVTSHTIEQ